MRIYLIAATLFLVVGCSNKNPLKTFIEEKTPDEIYVYSGEVIEILKVCKEGVDNSKCINSISLAVNNLSNSGYEEIEIKHLNKSTASMFYNKIKMSDKAKDKLKYSGKSLDIFKTK